eukprot:gene9797-biopygen3249
MMRVAAALGIVVGRARADDIMLAPAPPPPKNTVDYSLLRIARVRESREIWNAGKIHAGRRGETRRHRRRESERCHKILISSSAALLIQTKADEDGCGRGCVTQGGKPASSPDPTAAAAATARAGAAALAAARARWRDKEAPSVSCTIAARTTRTNEQHDAQPLTRMACTAAPINTLCFGCTNSIWNK